MYPFTQQEKTRRIASWLDGTPEGPSKMEIEVTDLCQLKCRFCWMRDSERAKHVDPARELTAERWLEIVREAASLGVLEWRICGGGEPLMRYDTTIPMCTLIKELGMFGHLTTNGQRFDDDDIRRFVEVGWDLVEFSLEGPTAEINDPLRGKGSWEKVMRCIRLFKTYKERLGKDKPKITISTVLTRYNYFGLPDFMTLAAETGIAKIAVNPITIMGDYDGREKSTTHLKLIEELAEDVPRTLTRAKEIADRGGVETNVEQFLEIDLIGKTNTMDEVIREDVEKFRAGCTESSRAGEAARPDTAKIEDFRDRMVIDRISASELAADRPYTEVDGSGLEGDKPCAARAGQPAEGGVEGRIEGLYDQYNAPCYAPWYCIAIRPYGKVGACVLFDETELDLHRMSLEEVWTSPMFEQMRADLKTNRIPWYCRRCSPNNVHNEREIRERLHRYQLEREEEAKRSPLDRVRSLIPGR
ncbi:radical SAM/SPASM domain-containing protein [Thermodesulfobacteriota bacterium]